MLIIHSFTIQLFREIRQTHIFISEIVKMYYSVYTSFTDLNGKAYLTKVNNTKINIIVMIIYTILAV